MCAHVRIQSCPAPELNLRLAGMETSYLPLFRTRELRQRFDIMRILTEKQLSESVAVEKDEGINYNLLKLK